jgi:hypothetical protein
MQDRLREAMRDPDAPPVPDPVAAPEAARPFKSFLNLPGVPGRLLKANRMLAAHLGWTLPALIGVFAVAVDTPGERLASRSRAELVAEAADYTGEDPAHAAAAVDFLTLDPARLELAAAWEQERRPHRLFLRPLVPTGDGDLLIPRHLVRALWEVTADMLGEGRLIWPGVPDPVTDAMNDFRKVETGWLERSCEAQVDKTGMPYRPNLEPRQAAAGGIPGLAGEVDLLICDRARQQLWVVEVKHRQDSASPDAVDRRVADFLDGRRSHVAKLLSKAAQLERYLDAAIALADPGGPAPGPSEHWAVRPVLATYRLEPAAYASDVPPAVEFVLAHRLAEHLGFASGVRYGTAGFGDSDRQPGATGERQVQL